MMKSLVIVLMKWLVFMLMMGLWIISMLVMGHVLVWNTNESWGNVSLIMRLTLQLCPFSNMIWTQFRAWCHCWWCCCHCWCWFCLALLVPCATVGFVPTQFVGFCSNEKALVQTKELLFPFLRTRTSRGNDDVAATATVSVNWLPLFLLMLHCFNWTRTSRGNERERSHCSVQLAS